MSSVDEKHMAISKLVRLVKDLSHPYLGAEASAKFFEDLNKNQSGRNLTRKLKQITIDVLYPREDYEVSTREFIKSNAELVRLVESNKQHLKRLYDVANDCYFKEIYDAYITQKASENLANSVQGTSLNVRDSSKGMMELIFEKEIGSLKNKGADVRVLQNFIKLLINKWTLMDSIKLKQSILLKRSLRK